MSAGQSILLPDKIEVWCCADKKDNRTELYLDGAMLNHKTQELGFVYRRHGNDDFYTKVKNRSDMFIWLNDPDNISEPKIV